MKQAVHDFLEYQASAGLADKTLYAYRRNLQYFREYARRKKVKDIRNVSLRLVRSYHDTLIKRGLTSQSRRAYLSPIRLFLQWAYQHNLILSDVASRIELPKLERRLPPTPLTEEDVSELLSGINTSTVGGKRTRAVFEILYGCGLRKEELLRLRVGDVNADEGTLFVRGKGDKERLVPINDVALASIADYLRARGGKPRKSSPLFLTHDVRDKKPRAMNATVLDNTLRRINKKFPKHIHLHLFRHTFALHLLQNGADLRYVQALLGHESPDTTGIYLGMVKADVKRAYDAAMEIVLSGV